MTNLQQQIGATSPGMSALLALWLVSGVLMLVAFQVPDLADTIPSSGLLLIAVTFVGSGLVYLALIPFEEGEAT